MREKLIEMLADLGCNAEYCKDCEFCSDVEGCVRRQKEIIVDRLIANGVTIPVRCKDCKHLYKGMDDYCCTSHRGLARICENSFCSYGERRTDV